MNPETIMALQISGIGLAGVFLFMTVFYFVIIGIDKLFPIEEKKASTLKPSGDTKKKDNVD